MRKAIAGLGRITQLHPHQGLYFDTRAGQLRATGTGAELVRETAQIGVPRGYEAFLKRWLNALQASEDTLVARAATYANGGRLVVGLGGDSVIETAMTFHRTYGVPYIPGSALKGLARAFARQKLDKATWGVNSEAFQILFGDQDEAGYVTFHDALPAPARFMLKPGVAVNQGFKVHPDVLTPHHPEYYQQNQGVPADWDSPTPIAFPSASGTFLLAVSGPEGWREVALQILGLALLREGIGGKTSSGYGRLEVFYADAGVAAPNLVFEAEPKPAREPGAPAPRGRQQNAATTPAATRPAAPAAPAKPSLTADAFLAETKGLKLNDKRDNQKLKRDNQKLQQFMRGGLQKFQSMAEEEQLKAAKALWQLIAGGSKGREYDMNPLFMEVRRILGK